MTAVNGIHADGPLAGPSAAANSAEAVARAAKEAFDAAQMLADADVERIRALQLVRQALASAKQEILDANKRDVEVRNQYTNAKLKYADSELME